MNAHRGARAAGDGAGPCGPGPARPRTPWPRIAWLAGARVPLLLALLFALASGAHGAQTARPLFESEATLALTLQAPWAELQRHAKAKRSYPALLLYTGPDGTRQRLAATVAARGISRLRHCRMPPLRLRFEAAATAASVFAGQRELKLVTHCRDGRKYAQYTVQEWLAYRIWRLHSAQAYRTRPLELQYQDGPDGEPAPARFAFLIEDTGEMARRHGMRRDPAPAFSPADFDSLALSRLMLFQYLIGNTDFAVLSGPTARECCHNVRVIGARGAAGRIAVPYDFDAAGIVDAAYAAPHESLPIRKVTERLYRGFCAHADTLQAARAEFGERRAAVLALIREEPRLDAQRRRAMLAQVEDFYATLASDWRFDREISRKCRK